MLERDGHKSYRSLDIGLGRNGCVSDKICIILLRILLSESVRDIDTLEGMGSVSQPSGGDRCQVVLGVLGIQAVYGNTTLGCTDITAAVNLQLKTGLTAA